MKYPMSLGQFISYLRRFDAGHPIEIDRLGCRPTTFLSYRGFYERLALGYHSDRVGSAVCVGELLSSAESCVGRMFKGYKGGNYMMQVDTPLYICNWGLSNHLSIKSIRFKRIIQAVRITTCRVDD